MSKIFTIVGIILTMIGTIFSLWSVLGTKSNYVQTAAWCEHQQESFKKDKKRVIVGTVLIIIGSFFQIISLFL